MSQIIEPIKKRFSPVIFDPRPVEADKLKRLFEAAASSASSFNEQPWRYVVIDRRDEERFEAAVNCLAEFNQIWARHAPLLVIDIVKKHFDHNDKENRHAEYDLGQSVATLAIQAAAEDLYLRQMAGFDAQAMRDLLDLPENYTPFVVMALGYRGNPGAAEDILKKREKARSPRRPINEIVYHNNWKEPIQF